MINYNIFFIKKLKKLVEKKYKNQKIKLKNKEQKLWS